MIIVVVMIRCKWRQVCGYVLRKKVLVYVWENSERTKSKGILPVQLGVLYVFLVNTVVVPTLEGMI